MTNLTLLPLVRLADGVQIGEDWSLAIAFYLDDGVTPIPLNGLTFTLMVGGLTILSSGSGQIMASGPSNNVLVISCAASITSGWSPRVVDLSLAATDGVSIRDLFALSTLAIGAPQVARITLLVAPDVIPQSLVSPLPAALAQAFQALQPSSLVATLAALPAAQLTALSQALVAALPSQTSAAPPVPTGEAFVNVSGYVVIAQ
jgi:hypothetical protein